MSLIGALFCAGCTGDPRSAEDACIADSWQAVEAENKGDYAGAETHYLQALDQSKQSNTPIQLPQVLQGLGKLYAKEEKFSRAEASLRQELESYKAIEKGSHLMAASRLDMVEGRVQCLEALATVMARQGKPDEAAQLYGTALSLNKDYGGSVGTNLRISKNYAEFLKSIHKFEQADRVQIEVDAANLTAQEVNRDLNPGLLLVFTRFDPAHSALKLRTLALAAQRLQKYDRLQQALYYLGLAELRSGRVDQAEAAFRKWQSIITPEKTGGVQVKFEANMAMALAAVACCLEMQGKPSDANDFFMRAMRFDADRACQMISYVGTMTIKSGKDEYAQLLAQRLFILADETKQDKEKQLVANTITSLANDFREQLKFADGVPLDRRALAIYQKAAKPNSRSLPDSLNALGFDLRALHKYSEAKPILEEALAKYEADKSTDKSIDPQTLANSAVSLAEDYQGLHDYAQAAQLFKRALPLYAKANGPNSSLVARTLMELGDTYRSDHQYAESLPFYKQAVLVCENVHGKNSAEVGHAVFALEESYRCLHSNVEAEPLIKRALAILQAREPASVAVPQLKFASAENYRELKKYEEAQAFYDAAVPLFEKVGGPDYNIFPVLKGSAENLRRMGRFAQAEPLFKRVLSILEKTKGQELEVASTNDLLADDLQAQGKYLEAQTARKHALDNMEKVKGAHDYEVGETLRALAMDYRKQGNNAQAQPLYQRALAIYQKTNGAQMRVAFTYDDLADVEQAQGKYLEAQTARKNALAVVEKVKGANDPEVAKTLGALAQNYQMQHKDANAEQTYKQALAIYQKTNEHAPEVAQILGKLAQLAKLHGG